MEGWQKRDTEQHYGRFSPEEIQWFRKRVYQYWFRGNKNKIGLGVMVDKLRVRWAVWRLFDEYPSRLINLDEGDIQRCLIFLREW